MNQILKRDEYISEIYDPMMEQKKYEELVAINEGMLKNLFGKIKNLFKRDWGKIKGDRTIIDKYKELDDSLTGFSTMKLSKKDECNQIRQALVDFACDWYDMKMNHAKKAERDPKPAKTMEFKDETLKSNLETLQDKIKTIANGDEQMQKWADLLLNDMKVIINRAIINDINDEETKKEIEAQIKEDLKDPEKVNKIMEEWQNEQLTKIKEERSKLISDTQSTPIDENLLGDKAIQNLYGEFDQFEKSFEKIKKESNERKKANLLNKLQSPSLGFKSIFKPEDYSGKNFTIANTLIKSFFERIKGEADNYKEVPGISVQAMIISVISFIKNSVYGGENYGETLPLMAKCAILSDGTLSYNIPLNGKNGKNAGNYFTDELGLIVNHKKPYTPTITVDDGDGKKKNIKIPDDFNTNAKALLNKIVDEAKKLKEQAEKDYTEFAKKINFKEKKKES